MCPEQHRESISCVTDRCTITLSGANGQCGSCGTEAQVDVGCDTTTCSMCSDDLPTDNNAILHATFHTPSGTVTALVSSSGLGIECPCISVINQKVSIGHLEPANEVAGR